MEELQTRHRKEQQDLQSRITQKKKQANKKTRKGVNSECDRLESELKAQQQAEVAQLTGELPRTANSAEDATLGSDEDESPHTGQGNTGADVSAHVHREASLPGQPKKQNRQKARLARRAAEQQELAKQAVEEANDMPDMKQQERNRMLESLNERGLQEKEIRADGHCLYSAVADQLQQFEIPLTNAPSGTPGVPYKVVRAAAADFIETHRDDFEPFLEEPLSEYLHKVRDTGEWGGQLELTALAKTYGTDIHVLQDFGRVEKIDSGSNNHDCILWLGYYKHGFGLGEHYNSLRKTP